MIRVRASCLASGKAGLVPLCMLLAWILFIGEISFGLGWLVLYGCWNTLSERFGSLPGQLFVSVLLAAMVGGALIGFLWKWFGFPTKWIEHLNGCTE